MPEYKLDDDRTPEPVHGIGDRCRGGSCGCASGVGEQAAAVKNEADHTRGDTQNLMMLIEGMDCGDCAAKLGKAVGRMPGVAEASVNFATAKMKVVYDRTVVTQEDIIKSIRALGYTAVPEGTAGQRKTVLRIAGMDCADCAAKLEKRLAGLAGVKKVTVNFGAAKLTVEHELSVAEIVWTVEQAGYKAVSEDQTDHTGHLRPAWWRNPRMLATIASGAFLAAAVVLDWLGSRENTLIPLYVLAMLSGGYYVAKSGYYALRSLLPDMNFLMTIAAVGAAAIGQWSEGATVVFLFSLGNALQAYTMDKTRESIRALMDLAPREALVRRDGQETLLPVEEIVVGDVVIVKPGERIAMDGDVSNGTSTVNQAPITGESLPVEKKAGDIVYAGTVNEHGVLEITVTKLTGDSTLAKIMHLVEEAQAQKAPSQQFVDVFARYYTPTVIIGAIGVWLIPWLVLGQPFAVWFYRALVLLVIACPCALVISTPVSIVSAIGNASRNGVLIKGGAYLEEMGNIRAVAFDKTGTLTYGKPQVTDVVPVDGHSAQALLIAAATVERWSEHPLAMAIVAKAEGLTLKSAKNFQALVGRGAKAEVDGETVLVGNRRLFAEYHHDTGMYEEKLAELEQQGKTAMLAGTAHTLYGIIAVADTVRENSREALQTLRDAGIRQIAMLSGDNNRVARAVAEKLGLDAYFGELLPEKKVDTVRALARQYGKVAMVGDGVNDAPALAAANVGIAMGVAGSDTALETADIALMADDLGKLTHIIKLSRKTVGIIKQNIVFSLVVKGVFVLLTVMGLANLWMAILADTGASIIVTLNGMRLARRA
ncbi:MAG TPA: heavy metal translocating P-type ATPase [Negativicutes bacterium]|nr:heavy metal translocating P-type ATPase [Negativicutes bacterium]